MKNILKSAAAVTCAAALLCATGCSDTKWSFKTDHKTLSSGVWINYTFEGVSDALTKMQETNKDATLDSLDFEKDKIDDMLLKDWAYAEAKKKELRYLTLDKLAAQLDVEVSDDTYNSAKNLYSSIYKSYYSEMFEKLGVSEDSYCQASVMPNLLSDEIFTKLYGKGGSKEVADKNLQAYFVDNYVSYYYVSCDLTVAETTTSTDTEASQTETTEAAAAKRVDDKTLATYTENFTKYANMLNNGGKTTADVAEEYKKDFGVETVPETSETVAKDTLSTENKLQKAILDAKEGKAVTQEIDDKLYLIYRFDIKTKTDKIKAADDNTDENETEIISREDILKKMKSEEFEKYLDDEQDKLDYVRNDACIHKYDVMRTVGILKSNTNG